MVRHEFLVLERFGYLVSHCLFCRGGKGRLTSDKFGFYLQHYFSALYRTLLIVEWWYIGIRTFFQLTPSKTKEKEKEQARILTMSNYEQDEEGFVIKSVMNKWKKPLPLDFIEAATSRWSFPNWQSGNEDSIYYNLNMTKNSSRPPWLCPPKKPRS